MLSDAVFGKLKAREPGFRWRGDGDISRIEGFSDNVFGFALTLLVVSLEVPATFTDLEQTLRGFIGFAFAFALLFLFWYEHYIFFRRFALESTAVIWLNAVLLFCILFFVYPLKFLISILGKIFTGMPLTTTMPDGSTIPVIQYDQMSTLMIVYGAGFVIIYALFTILYVLAFARRLQLDLSESECIITRGSIIAHASMCAIGLLSIVIAGVGGTQYAGIAGYVYFIIGPVQGTLGRMTGRKVSASLAKSAQTS